MEKFITLQVSLSKFFEANPASPAVMPDALWNHLGNRLIGSLIPSLFPNAVLMRGESVVFGHVKKSFVVDGMIFECEFNSNCRQPFFSVKYPTLENRDRRLVARAETVRRVRNALLEVEKGVSMDVLLARSRDKVLAAPAVHNAGRARSRAR